MFLIYVRRNIFNFRCLIQLKSRSKILNRCFPSTLFCLGRCLYTPYNRFEYFHSCAVWYIQNWLFTCFLLSILNNYFSHNIWLDVELYTSSLIPYFVFLLTLSHREFKGYFLNFRIYFFLNANFEVWTLKKLKRRELSK